MLLILVVLIYYILSAEACLQCDRGIRNMHDDFILSAPAVNDQIELQKICDYAYVTYIETSQNRKGVIDPTTLYRAKTEYVSEFDRFLKTEHSGSLTFETIQIMEKGRKILEKHLDAFIRDGLCPNLCGLLNRRVMDCVSCKYKVYICPSLSNQLDCGDYPVQAEEGGQAVLDCYRPWHRLHMGKPEYSYSWLPAEPGTQKLTEQDFRPLVVTHDSSVVLNQLHLDEEGTYRCSLQDQNGMIFYRVTFLLSVSPLPLQTSQAFVTLPSLAHGGYSPFQPTEGLLLAAIAMVTALGLVASVGLSVLLGMMTNWQRRDKGSRSSRKQEKYTESAV